MEVVMLPVESQKVEKGSNDNYFAECSSVEDVANMRPIYFEFFQLVKVDIEFPELVTNALEVGIKTIKGFIPPIMWISKAGHDDIGAVFGISNLKRGDFEVRDERHMLEREKGIAARVSYGGEMQRSKMWSSYEIDRLHISAFGFKRFLPIETELKKGLEKDECLSNEVHYSMRWKKTDNEWIFHNPYGVMLQPSRTPWMRTQKLQSFVKKLHIETSLMPDAIDLDKHGQPTRNKRELILEQIKARETTHSSYSAIAKFLSIYGDVGHNKEIGEMTPREGIEYLFDKIVPALGNFIK